MTDPHGSPDVASTLSELERKLKELEHELQTVGHSTTPPPAPPQVEPAGVPAHVAPPAEPVPPPQGSAALTPGQDPSVSRFAAAPGAGQTEPAMPPAPSPPASTWEPAPIPADPDAARLVEDARERIGGLHGQLDDLLRFREQLVNTANELVAEYERLLGGFSAAQASAPPTVPPSAVLPPPVPAAPAAPVYVAAPVPPVGPAAPFAQDATLFEGHMTVDAGPFTDISTLSGFEQGLARISGVGDVYVRGFEGNRALVDVQLSQPVALAAELAAVTPLPFTIGESSPGRLVVHLEGVAMAPEQQPEKYQPLALISVVLIALLGFAVFFLSFLVAPLAILVIFYVGFAASDRSKRSNGGGPPPPAGSDEEAEQAAQPANRLRTESDRRRAVIERSQLQTGQAAVLGIPHDPPPARVTGLARPIAPGQSSVPAEPAPPYGDPPRPA